MLECKTRTIHFCDKRTILRLPPFAEYIEAKNFLYLQKPVIGTAEKMNFSKVIAKYRTFVLLISLLSCSNDSTNNKKYAACNSLMSITCDGNGIGEYCTLGFKWGDGNPFSNAGLEKPGPSLGPAAITYKFQDAGVLFSTHSQENLTSLAFSNCIKDTIRLIFKEWESVAAISFEEKSVGEESNITVIMANIQQGGIGYPAFPEKPCSDIAGSIILNTLNFPNCTNFYRSGLLHEIGHAMGLGHVQSNVVMNPNVYKNFSHLQSGDIKGIQSIYGKK